MSIALRSQCRLSLLLVLVATTAVPAQDTEPAAQQPEIPEIADKPKTVDPATLVPEKLAAQVTVDFSDSSLREVLQWLRDEQELVVLVDNKALTDQGLTLSEPVSDHLNEEPLYLLLNRLRAIELAWRYSDDILHITTPEGAESELTTVPYNVGDLLDAEFDADTLAEVVESTISPESWEAVGGPGALTLLGDVMFIRQTDDLQNSIQGLLAALREHGRRTFVLDPPQHEKLREQLESNVSVEFLDTPLVEAIAQLAEASQTDIRLDSAWLRAERIREREPITLRLTDRKLKTVLQAMLLDLNLTWILRDGVMWVTTPEAEDNSLKTAVFDVRDLCRDSSESDALAEALQSQTSGEMWADVGGPGQIAFARPGTLVVLNTENLLNDVLDLLETYRTALRNSKPRDRGDDANKLTTVYYRMHANVAEDLYTYLPQLVQPETWRSPLRPLGKGEVLRVASKPELISKAKLAEASAATDATQTESLFVARAVLIIKQTREVHEEIREVIRRVESGDSFATGGGMGGGGFGGGLFSLPPNTANEME